MTTHNVMLCFGDYWQCPIDEEECKVSYICHLRAIRNRDHDITIRNQTIDKVLSLISLGPSEKKLVESLKGTIRVNRDEN